MKIHYACQSPEHRIARRQFLGTVAAAGAGAIAGGLAGLSTLSDAGPFGTHCGGSALGAFAAPPLSTGPADPSSGEAGSPQPPPSFSGGGGACCRSSFKRCSGDGRNTVLLRSEPSLLTDWLS